jgi:predicted O-linked N-acetylglucosamine transferase (SPINDLY family)
MHTPLSQADIDMLIALYRENRLSEVIERGERLAQQEPGVELLHNILGAAHAGLLGWDDAIHHFEKALALSPASPQAHSNLGNVYRSMGRAEDAVECHRRALAIQPAAPEVLHNLGNGLFDLGRFDEAIATYEQALRLNPRYAEAACNLAIALRAIGRRHDAIALSQHALSLRPDYPEALYVLGCCLKELQRRREAIPCFQRALVLKPDHAESHCELGNIMAVFGHRIEAIGHYRRALAIRPDYAAARAFKLHQQAHICDWAGIAEEADFIPTLGLSGDGVSPFCLIGLEDEPALQRQRAERYGRQSYPDIGHRDFFRPSVRPQKLRVGYFSADFHDHATMYLIARLLELHDRARFEIHAFSYGPDRDDEMRRRATEAVDTFHDVRDLADQDAAGLARSHGIDVAIDLKGYTVDSRLGIFSQRAAPVQIAYLGYPGTSGLPFIDYLIADRIIVPSEQRADYSEKLIYMPHCYQATDDRRQIAEGEFTRSGAGLPEQSFVFASFNNNFKITPAEFGIWLRLLHRVENSVLWLLATNEWSESNLRHAADKAGLSPERLIFAEKLPAAEHLARQRLADLFLDSFDCNAHTTASDALWAGLPILTKAGRGFPARVSASLLHAIGLSSLVTEDERAYEERAFALATDAAMMANVRDTLARNRTKMPLFDSLRFVRDIEQGYDRAYALHLAGKAPEDIHLG